MTQDIPPDLRELSEKAVRLHASGKLEEAAEAYRQVLAHCPAHPAVLHNLGVIAAVRDDHGAAVAYFDQALAADGRYLVAQYHRAISLEALGKIDGAISGYRQVVRADPGHYGAHRRLAFLWLAAGDIGRAMDHFARTYDLRRGEDKGNSADRSLTHASRDKLRHDAALFRYLADARPDRGPFAELARGYERVAQDFPDEVSELSAARREILGEDFNTAIHLMDAPALAEDMLGTRSSAEIASVASLTDCAGAVVLDDFLSPEAFVSLRRFLLGSTIWHDFSHIDGHVASYLEDGLACPLLLQIADAVRRAFPDPLGSHPLSQAWAFKGVRQGAVIGAHADDAAISVNLWLTPDAANAGPEGGMTVCLEPPPGDWEVADYAKDQGRSARFMDRHADKSVKVPYRENRAVIFPSRLLHRSDVPRFKGGYENHRINITMLYGAGARPGRGAAD